MSKFKLGELVRYRAAISNNAPRDAFQIIRVLPSERGVVSCRIKSTVDGHERVAEEQELEAG
jgi:hypothetical protein